MSDRQELKNALILLILMAAVCWLSYTAGWMNQQDDIEAWKQRALDCQIEGAGNDNKI